MSHCQHTYMTQSVLVLYRFVLSSTVVFVYTVNSMTNQVVKNILILNSPEDSGPAIRELEGLLQQFESMFADSKSYPQAKAYLVSQLFCAAFSYNASLLAQQELTAKCLLC
jgi:hypothetical protein